MNKNRIFALALSAAMLFSLTACATKNESHYVAPAGVAVQVEEVTRTSITSDNRSSGKVASDNETPIYVSTTALCTAVYVSQGDTVAAGDKICTLDMASTLASYKAANINYQALLKQYNDQKGLLDRQIAMAENNLITTQKLFEIGAASKLEVDNAQLTLDQALMGRDSGLAQLEAGIQSGKSGLEQLEMVLEHVDSNGNVISPAAGIVTSLTAMENNFVAASYPIAIIQGADQMKVSVYVSEAVVPALKVGAEAEVSVPNAGISFTGTIRSVDQSPISQLGLYGVTISVPAEVSGLMVGMFADVTFHLDGREDVIVIPTQSIQNNGEIQYVYVVENDTAVYTEITTGLTGSGVTEVTSGLEGGETLVTVGQTYLTDGSAVRVVNGEG